jgi:hypothetical protein
MFTGLFSVLLLPALAKICPKKPMEYQMAVSKTVPMKAVRKSSGGVSLAKCRRTILARPSTLKKRAIEASADAPVKLVS